VAPVQGLTGLTPATAPATGYPGYYTEGWIDPYEQYASPADQVPYGQYTWEVPPPVPWLLAQDAQGWVPPPAPVLDTGDGVTVLGAETDPDLSTAPIETGSHTAPFPAFGIDDSVPFNTDYSDAQLMESAAIHASDTGQAGVYLQGPEPADPWERDDINYLSAGSTMLDAGVPDQLRGNMGLDHTQGFEPDARYGFNEGFTRMPHAHSEVAGNFFWLDPATRPVEVRPTGYRDWPVGQMSPFTGQVPGTHGLGDTQGAVIDYAPPEYVPPAEPAVAQPLPADNATWSVWLWPLRSVSSDPRSRRAT
jgi:hypothetical protein